MLCFMCYNIKCRLISFPAYHVVSQSYGLDDQGSSGDDSDASDLEVMDVSIQ